LEIVRLTEMAGVSAWLNYSYVQYLQMHTNVSSHGGPHSTKSLTDNDRTYACSAFRVSNPLTININAWWRIMTDDSGARDRSCCQKFCRRRRISLRRYYCCVV